MKTLNLLAFYSGQWGRETTLKAASLSGERKMFLFLHFGLCDGLHGVSRPVHCRVPVIVKHDNFDIYLLCR